MKKLILEMIKLPNFNWFIAILKSFLNCDEPWKCLTNRNVFTVEKIWMKKF